MAFRAYLLTAVRRLHIDKVRSTARVTSTDDLTPFDPGVPFTDTAVAGFEGGAAAKAFASLPERWQLVLWHLEVENQKPADIAPLLGMSPNSVSALAYRAREGLRQAFLQMHTGDLVSDACRDTNDLLGGYVRGALSRRDAGKVDDHLERCRRCTAVYLELAEVNSSLAAVLGPALLGGAAAGYLGTGAVTGIGAGVLTLLGRGKEVVVTHVSASAATAAVIGVAGITAFSIVHQDPGGRPASADERAQTGITQQKGSGSANSNGSGSGSTGTGATGTTADAGGLLGGLFGDLFGSDADGVTALADGSGAGLSLDLPGDGNGGTPGNPAGTGAGNGTGTGNGTGPAPAPALAPARHAGDHHPRWGHRNHPQAHAETHPETHPETHAAPETDAQADPETDPDAQAHPQAHPNAQAHPQAHPDAQAEPAGRRRCAGLDRVREAGHRCPGAGHGHPRRQGGAPHRDHDRWRPPPPLGPLPARRQRLDVHRDRLARRLPVLGPHPVRPDAHVLGDAP